MSFSKIIVALTFVCITVGSTFAAVLDFDNIATVPIPPSFQPEWHNAVVQGTNAPNGQYIYFTVIPAGGIQAQQPAADEVLCRLMVLSLDFTRFLDKNKEFVDNLEQEDILLRLNKFRHIKP